MKYTLSIRIIIFPVLLLTSFCFGHSGKFNGFAEISATSLTSGRLIPGDIVTFTTSGEHRLSYHVYTPSHFNPQVPPPIVIGFSSGGRGRELLDSFKDAAEEMGWIGVGCDSLQNKMVVGDTIQWEMERELLDQILSSIPHDPSRIYLTGGSGGGMRCYGISARREYQIAGILAHGGWLGGPDYQDEPYQEGMDIAMLNGNLDMGAGAWTVMDTKTLRKHNCTVKHFTCMGGHVVAPADVTLIAFKWMDEQWHRRREPQSDKVALKVLYVGSDRQRKLDFAKFLREKFYQVKSVAADSVTLAMCNEADILVLDEPVYSLPDNYNKAMIIVGPPALFTGQRFGSRMQVVAVSDEVYAMVPDTASVLSQLQSNEKQDYESIKISDGSDEREVWKLSKQNGASVVLVDAKPFLDVPDAEILLRGITLQGEQGAVVLREGSRLFWGDSTIPSQMTVSAQNLFLNSMLWIYDWDGERQSVFSELTPRDSIMLLIDRMDIRAKDAMRWFPEQVLEECAYDKEKLRTYYRENMPYVFNDFGSGQLSVDRWAREFGTPNNEAESILKWIEVFETGGWPAGWWGRYLLSRYVGVSVRQGKNWKEWYAENKEKLRFSDEDGYRFILEE